MKKIFLKIKYPKLFLLLITFLMAYGILAGQDFLPFHEFLLRLGYLGIFLAGILFAYGFTAAPATALLVVLSAEQNILLAGGIAGLGALVGDLVIFKWIRDSFGDEVQKLSREKEVRRMNKKLPHVLKRYLIPVLAGFIIASPLPDEIGVSLLAVSQTISPRLFSVISYVLNTAGIIVILLISRSI